VVVTRANPERVAQCRRNVFGVSDNRFENVAICEPTRFSLGNEAKVSGSHPTEDGKMASLLPNFSFFFENRLVKRSPPGRIGWHIVLRLHLVPPRLYGL